MKKKIVTMVTCLMIATVGIFVILAQASSVERLHTKGFVDDPENGLFMFDSDRHVVHSPDWHGSEIIPLSFFEFDANGRNGTHTAIVVGEVAGPSVNRIINPALHLRDLSVVTGDNHVITPVLVHYIIRAGEEFPEMEVGEIIRIKEGYFYVTSETQEYFGGTSIGEVVTNMGAWPMEAGNRYLILMQFNPSASTDSVYSHNGENFPSAMRREQVYLLDPNNSVRARADNPVRPHYAQWWQDAMDMYGHLYDLPWVTPIEPEEPEDPEEPIISTHTITFHSGDQGTFTNNETTITKEIEISQSSSITQVPQVWSDFGWEPIGWLRNDTGRIISSEAIMSIEITEDITFTAQYNYPFNSVIEVILEGATDFNIENMWGNQIYIEGFNIYIEDISQNIARAGVIMPAMTLEGIPATQYEGIPGYRILLDLDHRYAFDRMKFLDDGTIPSIFVYMDTDWMEYFTDFLNGQDPLDNEVSLTISNRGVYLHEWGGWRGVLVD